VSGVVQGGLEFVIAAYVVTALVLGGYAASIVVRHKAELKRSAREESR
jgi:heme exporter protein CcmD